MTVSAISPVSFGTFFDPATPAPLQVNAYFYFAGTLDPISVYVDAGLAIPFDQPVRSSGSGRLPAIWVGEIPTGYRVRIFDEYSTLLEDTDNIPGAFDPSGGVEPPPIDDNRLAKPGDIIFAFSNAQPREGCVLANGLTIGSVTSGATGRANADCEAAFKWLWQQDQFGLLAVSPSRGASADSDWAANKTIATPDLMGRGVVGMDAMGTTAKNRLAGVTFAAGDQAKLGSYGGAPTRVLVAGNIPAHNHAVNDPGHLHVTVLPNHTHGASLVINAVGDHSHTGYTDAQGQHYHDYNDVRADPQVASPGGAGPLWSGLPYDTTRSTAWAGNHSHNVQTYGAGTHAHTGTVSVAGSGELAATVATAATGITTALTGDGTAFELMQPFYVLCVYMHL